MSTSAQGRDHLGGVQQLQCGAAPRRMFARGKTPERGAARLHARHRPWCAPTSHCIAACYRACGTQCATHLHFRQEGVDVGERGVEHVRGQVVPHLEAAQHVRAPVPHAGRDGGLARDRGPGPRPRHLARQEAVQLVE